MSMIKANVYNFAMDLSRSISRCYPYLLIGFILTSLVTGAIAHEWYPSNCCGGGDCHPVPCQELVQDQSTRWWRWVPTAESEPRWPPGKALYFDFAPERLQGSPDGMCHTCVSNTMAPMCIFIPPGG
jgi:hypothetical protein